MIYKGNQAIIPMKYVSGASNDMGLQWFPYGEVYRHFPVRSASDSLGMIGTYHGRYCFPNTSFYNIPYWREKGLSNKSYAGDCSYPAGSPLPVLNRMHKWEYVNASGSYVLHHLRAFAPDYTLDNQGDSSVYEFNSSNASWSAKGLTMNNTATAMSEQASYRPGPTNGSPLSPGVYQGEYFGTPFRGRVLEPNAGGSWSGTHTIRVKPYAVVLLRNWTIYTGFGFGFVVGVFDTSGSGYWARLVGSDTWASDEQTPSIPGINMQVGHTASTTIVKEWQTSSGSTTNTYKLAVLKMPAGAAWDVSFISSSSKYITRPWLARKGKCAKDAECVILMLGAEYQDVT